MAVNDFSILWYVNLRIHGTISASKLIFDSRDKHENIWKTVKVRIISVKHSSSFISSPSEMLQLNCKVTA